MKRTLIYILIAIFALGSCKKGHEVDCFKGTGEIITETTSLSFFNKVEARGRISVQFLQDGKNEIEITCGENMLKGITYETIDSTLYLDNENKCNWVRRFDAIPQIIVHYTDLKYFRADNYYDNRFLCQHNGDSIKIEYWEGSGRTFFYGDVNYAAFLVHAGSGSFKAIGQANYTMLYHAGGAPNNLSEFKTHTLHINSNSNNDENVFCDSLLLGEIHWTGNTYYSGNPSIVKRFGTGSGQLIEN